MKTKLFLLQLILLSIASPAGFCQSAFNCFDINEIAAEPYLSGELFATSSTPDIVTYFNRDWLSGDIWLADGGIIRNIKIRYNGLLDELFCLEPESNRIIKLDKEAIFQFHFLNFQGDTSVYFRKLKVKRDNYNDSIEIFAQEIYNRNLSLFILHSFYFLRRETVPMNKSYTLKDIYKEEPVYYLRYLNNPVVEFKRFSRKNLYSFMPDKENQIRKYFRDSMSGKIKTNQEVMNFINFLCTIVNQ
jgi:hypothetical protein